MHFQKLTLSVVWRMNHGGGKEWRQGGLLEASGVRQVKDVGDTFGKGSGGGAAAR